MNIEPLESRIAPASLTFTDVDGDNVKITISGVGSLTLGVNVIVTADQLQTLDLSGAAFQGANVKIVATRAPLLGGDGFVNVGRINATGRDLGTVRVDGDLGEIDAGDPANPASACHRLTVHSLGRFGTSTGGSDLASDFDGKLDKLVVKSDVQEARIAVGDSVGTKAKIGSIIIGGSLIGGAASQSGFIVAPHGIGAVTIGGDVLGGSGDNSGKLRTVGTLGPVKIGGSVRGNGPYSGLIDGNVIVSVKIRGSLVGGAGGDSGEIFAGASIGSVTIGGDVRGGNDSFSGAIRSSTGIGTVKIGHNVQGGSGGSSGSIQTDGKLASVSIGGSLIGGSKELSGAIFSDSNMGAVKIGHDVLGGSGENSGLIWSESKLAGVSIGGSLIGGSNEASGAILSSKNMGSVKIGHDMLGGSGYVSGSISTNRNLAGVSIGGSLIGGAGNNRTGEIYSTKAMGPVKIGQDIIGGSASSSASFSQNGSIQGQRIASLFVGGSIRAGVDDSSGTLTGSGSVGALDDIGSITVKGSLVGSIGAGGDLTFAVISAGGQAGLSAIAKNDVAIKSIRIGGRVELALILAGYYPALQPKNADAQIGTVIVGGDWIASKLIAGVEAGPNNVFGDSDDQKITNIGQLGFKDTADQNGEGAVSRIAAVVIKGRALGTAASTDSALFGIEAQHIVSIKVAGVTVPLSAGAGNDLFANRRPLGVTLGTSDPDGFDFHAFEVA
jgi:hypothetical protein